MQLVSLHLVTLYTWLLVGTLYLDTSRYLIPSGCPLLGEPVWYIEDGDSGHDSTTCLLCTVRSRV